MNPFADTELLELPSVTSDNPYVAPVSGGKGMYDWTLAKQAALWVAAIAIGYLLLGAVGTWSAFRRDPNHRHEPILHTVVEFATDWKDGRGLE